MVNLTLRFVACYLHFFAVHDDDEVACVDVRGELGLMLAPVVFALLKVKTDD